MSAEYGQADFQFVACRDLLEAYPELLRIHEQVEALEEAMKYLNLGPSEDGGALCPWRAHGLHGPFEVLEIPLIASEALYRPDFQADRAALAQFKQDQGTAAEPVAAASCANKRSHE